LINTIINENPNNIFLFVKIISPGLLMNEKTQEED